MKGPVAKEVIQRAQIYDQRVGQVKLQPTTITATTMKTTATLSRPLSLIRTCSLALTSVFLMPALFSKHFIINFPAQNRKDAFVQIQTRKQYRQ